MTVGFFVASFVVSWLLEGCVDNLGVHPLFWYHLVALFRPHLLVKVKVASCQQHIRTLLHILTVPTMQISFVSMLFLAVILVNSIVASNAASSTYSSLCDSVIHSSVSSLFTSFLPTTHV